MTRNDSDNQSEPHTNSQNEPIQIVGLGIVMSNDVTGWDVVRFIHKHIWQLADQPNHTTLGLWIETVNLISGATELALEIHDAESAGAK